MSMRTLLLTSLLLFTAGAWAGKRDVECVAVQERMTAGAIVMKYGMNLRKKGEEGPLPEELTTFGAVRTAEGLAYLDENKWCKLDPDVADRVMPIALAAIREITQRHGREEALGSIGID